MNNWLADEMLVYEQLREARAKAARSRSLAAVERRRQPGVIGAWLAAWRQLLTRRVCRHTLSTPWFFRPLFWTMGMCSASRRMSDGSRRWRLRSRRLSTLSGLPTGGTVPSMMPGSQHVSTGGGCWTQSERDTTATTTAPSLID